MLGEVNIVDIKSTLYRLVPSCFPPIDLFETDDEVDAFLLAELEGKTNDRLRNELGDLNLVPPEHRLSGSGATPVMAAFTHVGNNNRFNGPDIGAYYAGLDVSTAIEESRFHRGIFLAASNETPLKLDMRCYINNLVEPVQSLFSTDYAQYLTSSTDYSLSQSFAMKRRNEGIAGFHYPSIRHKDGQCIVAFRPNALTPTKQGSHYQYVWDGKTISEIYELTRKA